MGIYSTTKKSGLEQLHRAADFLEYLCLKRTAGLVLNYLLLNQSPCFPRVHTFHWKLAGASPYVYVHEEREVVFNILQPSASCYSKANPRIIYHWASA